VTERSPMPVAVGDNNANYVAALVDVTAG